MHSGYQLLNFNLTKKLPFFIFLSCVLDVGDFYYDALLKHWNIIGGKENK